MNGNKGMGETIASAVEELLNAGYRPDKIITSHETIKLLIQHAPEILKTYTEEMIVLGITREEASLPSAVAIISASKGVGMRAMRMIEL